MPDSLKQFLVSLPAEDFKAVWLYFDTNPFAMTEMTDVLVAAHPDAK